MLLTWHLGQTHVGHPSIPVIERQPGAHRTNGHGGVGSKEDVKM